MSSSKRFEVYFFINKQTSILTKMPKVSEKKTKSVEVSEVAEQSKPDVTMFIGDSNLRNTDLLYTLLD